MPPFVPGKRRRSPSPASSPPSKNAKCAPKGAKPTLFDTADAPTKKQKSVAETKKLLEELNDDDDDASLSEADSDDFEDVPPAKRRKTASTAKPDDEGESEEEMDWEDAIDNQLSAQPTPGPSTAIPEHEIADVSFSLMEDGGIADQGIHTPGLGKKGLSKREKWVRIQSHCLHVQSLMWHNTIRNSWLNDKEVQKTLVDGLTEGVKREVTRWKEAMGTLSKDELEAQKKAAATKGKTKRGRKGKEKSGRDWSYEAAHAEQGVPNLSAGDPLLRLLKVLAAYWRKRFTITAPGLRKQGYMAIKRLRDEVKDWEKDKADAEEHGERVESIEQFRKLVKGCEGSRDVGAQLFAALLRGLGLDTRMVANLQPVGFGFSKSEEADAKRPKKKAATAEKAEPASDSDVLEVKPKKAGSSKNPKTTLKKKQPSRTSGRGNKGAPINLDDSDSPLSSVLSEADGMAAVDDSDDISVIDITPLTPKKKPNKKYDRDMVFPNYWVEICSPATHRYIPVDPIVLATIASNEELLQTFEPRGKKAELSKQVMAYTIAFSADGTATDVTVRYLKKHQLPGKTKGMRMPAEKVPIYNGKGKVKRYEEYDWFRTVMSAYERPDRKRTAADDLEQQTDLKPPKPEKQEKEVEKESLQWYKQSATYVLEQHLRREEALLLTAQPVKSFTAGKGDKAKESPVFLRSDVVACKTVESWHKEGRALKKGQHPMKLVPMRAVTLIRKREMEDAQRKTGEKLKQGLYSIEQTDWITPPPIRGGVIPKNAFGNMDVYVPTMVPEGAVHVPLKGTAKICRKLEIDYAEACTGFEFGKQRAVPVLTGVVVAEEHEIVVREAWREEQREAKRKEDTKRTGLALGWWRKMVLGLRVLERIRVDYEGSGGKGREMNPFVAKARREGKKVGVEKGRKADYAETGAEADARGGGFFLPGHYEEEVPQHHAERAAAEAQHEDMEGGGFLVESGDEDCTARDGGFLVEEHPDDAKGRPPKNHAPITPVSLQSLHKAVDGAHDGLDDVEDEDKGEVLAAPAVARPANARSAQRVKGKRTPNATVTDDEDESALSELDEASSDESAGSDIDSDSVVTPPVTRKSLPASLRVLISPPKSGRRGTQLRSSRAAKKTTPLKSQYFATGEAEGSDEDGGQSTEAEVVRPRRTTARTRKSG